MSRRTMLMMLALLTIPVRSWAQRTQGRRIVGDVVVVRPNRLHVKSIGDRAYTITLNQATKIRRGEESVTVDDIRVGERVVIDVGDGREPLMAREVLLAASAVVDLRSGR